MYKRIACCKVEFKLERVSLLSCSMDMAEPLMLVLLVAARTPQKQIKEINISYLLLLDLVST